MDVEKYKPPCETFWDRKSSINISPTKQFLFSERVPLNRHSKIHTDQETQSMTDTKRSKKYRHTERHTDTQTNKHRQTHRQIGTVNG